MNEQDANINNLRGFISDVLDAAQCETKNFSIYCIDNELPEEICQIKFQKEFLIFFKNIDSRDVAKLKSLMRREDIYFSSNYCYWFEGISNTFQPGESILDLEHNSASAPVEMLESESILPSWLNATLFNELNADYAPDHERYNKNLDLDDDELNVYLGTYFPRSYAECFCIFDDLFSNDRFVRQMRKEEINILDIGSGTGGDLIGLLVAISKYTIAKRINICAIDGHAKALSILKNIAENFAKKENFELQIQIINMSVSTIQDLPQFDYSFDYILSFKMINELIANGQSDHYSTIAEYSLPKLTQNGLFLLCDVTTKVGSKFNPILMNEQINAYLSKHFEYKTLLPKSCGEFEQRCNVQCFTQRRFNVSHTKKKNDKSLITYRIIGNADFVSQMSIFDSDTRYINIPHRSQEGGYYCVHTLGRNNESDNYKY